MRQIHDIEINNMLEKAKMAMERAYAPFSGFTVGACLKGATGAYYLGANIENSSFGATICGERVSLARAVYEGERELEALAVISSGDEIATPCGICLQALAEFCNGDMPVICANKSGQYEVFSFLDLCPKPFKLEK